MMGRTKINGFTLVELLAVVVVMGVLAAAVVPQFGALRRESKTSAGESIILGVRAAVAEHRFHATIAGEPLYLTATQLETPGTSLDSELPPNPWTGVSGVREVSAAEADGRVVNDPMLFGWAYYADNASNPPRATFYANCQTPTGRTESDGSAILANEL